LVCKSRRLIVSLASVVLAGAAFTSLPALAENTPPAADAATTPAALAPDATVVPPAGGGSFTVTIPTVDAKDSTIDDATLKAILSGDIAGHASELAKLNASSIHVPEIDVVYQPAAAGRDNITYTYKDIDVTSVRNGVAQSIVIGSAEGSNGADFNFKFGKTSTGLFDIGGLLAFYGLVPGSADQPPKTIYKDIDITGGTFSAPDLTCTLGDITVAEFKARPLKLPFGELMTLLNSAEVKGEQPSSETIGKLVSFYSDLFYAFQSSPMTLTRLDCSGKGDAGKPLAFSLGPLTVGAFGNGRYPEIGAQNLTIAQGDDDSMSLGSATLKSFDMSGPLKFMADAKGPFDSGWFETNARSLVPAFEGFAFKDLKLDAPDPEQAGARIKASVGDFDLTLGDYFTGIPTTVATSAHHVLVDVPESVAGDDNPLAALKQMGIDKLDLGFGIGVHRNAPADTLVIDKLAMDGAQLGSFNLSGVLGNATDTLYSSDNDQALAAGMALTLKALTVDVVDAGMMELVLKQAADGADLAAARTKLSGTAQGVILMLLGGTPDAQKLAQAVGKFINGGKSISVTATAKDAAGLSLGDFEAVQANPTVLGSKVGIDATAK
jgi:hypothetical protein